MPISVCAPHTMNLGNKENTSKKYSLGSLPISDIVWNNNPLSLKTISSIHFGTWNDDSSCLNVPWNVTSNPTEIALHLPPLISTPRHHLSIKTASKTHSRAFSHSSYLPLRLQPRFHHYLQRMCQSRDSNCTFPYFISRFHTPRTTHIVHPVLPYHFYRDFISPTHLFLLSIRNLTEIFHFSQITHFISITSYWLGSKFMTTSLWLSPDVELASGSCYGTRSENSTARPYVPSTPRYKSTTPRWKRAICVTTRTSGKSSPVSRSWTRILPHTSHQWSTPPA